MSKLKALIGKSKSITLGELSLEIKPLTIDDLDLFSFKQDEPMEEQLKKTKALMAKVLKDSVPDATDEEIAGISMEYMGDLMEAIMSINKFDKMPNVPGQIKK